MNSLLDLLLIISLIMLVYLARDMLLDLVVWWKNLVVTKRATRLRWLTSGAAPGEDLSSRALNCLAYSLFVFTIAGPAFLLFAALFHFLGIIELRILEGGGGPGAVSISTLEAPTNEFQYDDSLPGIPEGD